VATPAPARAAANPSVDITSDNALIAALMMMMDLMTALLFLG